MEFPMDLKLTQYTGLGQSPRQSWDVRPVDYRSKYALTYEPVLMALAGANEFDMTPDELIAALSQDADRPLHFNIDGRDDCSFQPYWALGNEAMTCYPKSK
jgi:hypothetical protein